MGRRVKDFHSFVGQQRVVRTLRALCDGAGKTGVLPPLLLVAPAGYGKTALAEAVARQLAGHEGDDRPPNFRDVHGGPKSLLAIHSTLMDANARDIVFVDEAHALEREDAELLYLAVDRRETLALDDKGHLDRAQHVKINPISLIVATNLPGGIPYALRSRCTDIVLDEYSDIELREIARRVATSHGLDITPQATRVLAGHCDQTPRGVEQLVTLIASMPHPQRITQGHVEHVLQHHLGHDANGLTPHHRRLIRMLSIAPLRAEQISSAFGFDSKYVRTTIENPLVTRGLLYIHPDRLRQLTPEGLKIARALAEEDRREQMFMDVAGLLDVPPENARSAMH